MTDYEARDDESTDGVELIRPTTSSYASGMSVSSRSFKNASGMSVQSVQSMSSKKCDDAKYLSRAATQATLAAKTILASGGSEDTALKTAKAAAQATLLESHIGIAAFSNTKGGASTFLKRRHIKRQSEVVASMALVSATNQLFNGTDSDIFSGTEDPAIQKMSIVVSKTPNEFSRPPRPEASSIRMLSPIIIHDNLTNSVPSANSKMSNLSIDTAKTETESTPPTENATKSKSKTTKTETESKFFTDSATKSKSKITTTETESKSVTDSATKSKSKTSKLDRNTGVVDMAESQTLGKGTVSQDAGKDSTAIVSHHSEKSSTGANRPRITVGPSVVPSKSNVMMNVEQFPKSNKEDDETLDEAIHFVNRGAAKSTKEKYEWLSTHSSSDISDADDDSIVSNGSFMEKHVDPCLFFWRCGGQNDVEETKVETKVESDEKSRAPAKKTLPTSKIERPLIVLSYSSIDSDTDDEDGTSSSEGPCDHSLTDRQKKFRSKLRAAARTRELAKLPKSEGREYEKGERKGPSKRDGSNSSQCSSLDAKDYSLSSQSSSFHKDDSKGKQSWKKQLGVTPKRDQSSKAEGQEDEKDERDGPPKSDGNHSSQCSILDAKDYSLSSQSSSFHKHDSKGKKSWHKLLGVRNSNSRKANI